MIKRLKQFTIKMVAGANMALVLIMLAVGFSDRLNPADHPVLSCVGMTFPILLLINLCFLFFWLTFKWRMVWIPILGYVATYIPISTYMPLNMQFTDPDEGAIKLISYNVCTYGGNYKYEDGFGTVCQYLHDEQPDIVCLQEDVDTWRRYAFKEFQKTFAYNDTVHFNPGPAINGVGIHTKFPIIRKERINYRSEANGSVAWYLQVGNDTLLVINNHFEGTHLSTEDRHNYQNIIKGNIKGQEAKHESKNCSSHWRNHRQGVLRRLMQYVNTWKNISSILSYSAETSTTTPFPTRATKYLQYSKTASPQQEKDSDGRTIKKDFTSA